MVLQGSGFLGVSVEYDVESIAGRPIVYASPAATNPGEECHRIRTRRNHFYNEMGRHIPAYTYMPTKCFKEKYEKTS